MAQLKEDEWPAKGEATTQEQQVSRDPLNGSKDPQDERRPWRHGRHAESRDQAQQQADKDTDAAKPQGRT